VWDLDETFWQGTLTEGGYIYIDANHTIVVELARRGIVSAICSKNDFSTIKAALEERGLWDFFVFPSIDWTPKPPRIAAMIEQMGLRPATVLFIDDNPQNLHQALDLISDINVAPPAIIPFLLHHPQLRGKDDSELTRLRQYKVLEGKTSDRMSAGSDDTAFLRKSDIRVYIDYDYESNIDRIIELVNRTNQLNFTKERLPEDPVAAKEILLPFLRHMGTTSGLVRVSDIYGDYGYVGFFAMVNVVNDFYRLRHFCFSCRILHMYVEHFVYNFLGRPALEIQGEVLSDITNFDRKSTGSRHFRSRISQNLPARAAR
jgi:FkbH-like protein